MDSLPSFDKLKRAAQKHLKPIEGLLGCSILIQEETAGWYEAASIGEVDPAVLSGAVETYDPKGTGAVEKIDNSRWLATYPVAVANTDIFFLFFLGNQEASKLTTVLTELESKAGWLSLSVLSELKENETAPAISWEIGAEILLGAPKALTRQDLASQWIAKIEKSYRPDFTVVAWVDASLIKTSAISGGGDVSRDSRSRTIIEKIALSTVNARGALLIDASAVQIDAQEYQESEDPNSLVQALNSNGAFAVPIYVDNDCHAVLIAFWVHQSGDELPDASSVNQLGHLLGEALQIHYRARPSIIRSIGNWFFGLFAAVFGKSALKVKIFVFLALVVIGIMELTPSTFRPSFDARLEAQNRTIIAAPYDGFLARAPFQIGDHVTGGDILYSFDTSDQRLELARVDAEVQRLNSATQVARAERNSAELRNLEAQVAQVLAERNLLLQEMEKSQKTAVSDGVIVGGDAWRKVGSRVRLGEPLLEIASLEKFRVLGFVDENWISDIPANIEGRMLLAAHPDTPIDVRLEIITNESEFREGKNNFAVWFEIIDAKQLELLDGMGGVIKLSFGTTSLLRSYVRDVRLWFDQVIWRWR